MKRLLDLIRDLSVCRDSHEDFARFQTDFKFLEIQAIENIDMTHRRFNERIGCWLAVLFLQIFFERSRVDPDSDRNTMVTA